MLIALRIPLHPNVTQALLDPLETFGKESSGPGAETVIDGLKAGHGGRNCHRAPSSSLLRAAQCRLVPLGARRAASVQPAVSRIVAPTDEKAINSESKPSRTSTVLVEDDGKP
jgi:hypothetical protein